MEDLLINLDKAEDGDLQRLRKIEDELKRVLPSTMLCSKILCYYLLKIVTKK